jgi:hypothetical protein
VRAEGEILARGKIEMNALSSEENRVFQQELVITGVELDGKDIMWNFQGEIFDSELNENFEIMYMQGEKFDSSIEGIGYHIRIDNDKTAGIEKKVYR